MTNWEELKWRGLVKDVADNATAISSEATRASQAELSLTTAITNETTRATTKETQLQVESSFPKDLVTFELKSKNFFSPR